MMVAYISGGREARVEGAALLSCLYRMLGWDQDRQSNPRPSPWKSRKTNVPKIERAGSPNNIIDFVVVHL